MKKLTIQRKEQLNHYKEVQKSLKLLYNPFLEITGNTLFAFYLTNIIRSFEKKEFLDDYKTNTKEKYSLKPLNQLKFDYTISTKDIIKSSESNSDNFSVDLEEYREKTFFTIFFLLFSLKFGKNSLVDLINNQKIIDNILLFDLKERINSFLKTIKCSNIKFINFCISMNNHSPEDTPGYEDIYINIKKMINDNQNIRDIKFAFQNDDKKEILEFQKYDFIYDIEKNVKKSKNKKFNYKKKTINVIKN